MLHRSRSQRSPTARPWRAGPAHLACSPFFFMSDRPREPEFEREKGREGETGDGGGGGAGGGAGGGE
jgi:hypothetical protein